MTLFFPSPHFFLAAAFILALYPGVLHVSEQSIGACSLNPWVDTLSDTQAGRPQYWDATR